MEKTKRSFTEDEMREPWQKFKIISMYSPQTHCIKQLTVVSNSKYYKKKNPNF